MRGDREDDFTTSFLAHDLFLDLQGDLGSSWRVALSRSAAGWDGMKTPADLDQGTGIDD